MVTGKVESGLEESSAGKERPLLPVSVAQVREGATLALRSTVKCKREGDAYRH